MSTKQPYLVINQEARTSMKYGTPMTKIYFLGIKDRKEYWTYVDLPHRNYKNWSHIINNPDHGFVLRNLQTKMHKNEELIDADSKPIIDVEMESLEEVMEIIAEFWEKEDRKRNTDKFRDLFE
jgi:hypothetical protein